MTAQRYVCVHGHFYQPPRENPWLENIDDQPSAYPYANWNARISAQCYRPNSAARILDGEGRIAAIGNNYARMSFDFGPTLMSWIAQHEPELKAAIVAADRDSQARFGGHGAAIAQAYNHMILPLANQRDKETQVLWGRRSFERTFGRAPKGMWLPETAVDVATLEVLAAQDIAFTVLAPRQALRIRPRGGGEWIDVSGERVDPARAYSVQLPSGRTIAVFFYDGPIARATAFDRLLESGEHLARQLLARPPGGEPLLMHIATDGETFGHHHRHGDMALAYALEHIENNGLAELTCYAQFLDRHPPEWDVEIVECSSWSCAHGVGRWMRDCGCHTGARNDWNQAWRHPLRAALDALRDRLALVFEREGGELLRDVWLARDHYVEIVEDRSAGVREAFFREFATRQLTESETVRALQLLECQRHAMLMYTSCAWFFDDISGIEPSQILCYAGRAIELAGRVCHDDVTTEFLANLRQARSNIAKQGDGEKIYRDRVGAAQVDLHRVIAHHAVTRLFEDNPSAQIYCYRVRDEDVQVLQSGRTRAVVGTVRVESEVTLATSMLSFGAFYAGDVNLVGGVRAFANASQFADMQRAVSQAFAASDWLAVQRALEQHFVGLSFSLKTLFPAVRERVLARILAGPVQDAEQSLSRLYQDNEPLLRYLANAGLELPNLLYAAAKHVLHARIRDALAQTAPGLDELQRALDARALLGVELSTEGLALAWQIAMERIARQLMLEPNHFEKIRDLRRLVELARMADVDVDLWLVQNCCMSLAAQSGFAAEWEAEVTALAETVRVRRAR